MKKTLLLLFVMILSISVSGQDNKFSATVRLTVQFDERELEKTIHSYLARELRSLGDVSLTDNTDNSDFKISVLGIKSKMQDGTETGYVLSVVITQTYSCIDLAKDNKGKPLFLELPDPELQAILRGKPPYSNYYNDLVGQTIYTTSKDGLRELCEKIITDFDNDEINIKRKLFDRDSKLKPKTKTRP